ncbi:hypothetical protein Daus18300_007340 [Diaporthe australafricana]|uniref:NmrA-like domain-containing protein n=1 Tax=Diaporthe australafricana TaxID=127596 RepID=A0ABR3WMV9_9PEZI
MIKQHRKTGQQETLKLMASQDAPVGIVEAHDVGVFAAQLLCQDDITVHNNARYVVNGPEDITGEQIVKMVEERIGTKVQSVSYKDMTFIDAMANSAPQGDRDLILSIKSAPVLELAAPTRTPTEVLETLLAE